MILAAIISIILIFLLIYRIGYLKNNTRGRYIYIVVFILVILINGFFLYDYVQVKSIHNYSTYITYQNLLDRISDVSILEIEDSSDIRTLNASIDRLNSQIDLLSSQLHESSLIRGSNKDIILNFEHLYLQLQAFTNYQNGIFTRGDEIQDTSIPLYNELRIKIRELYDVLEVEDTRLASNIIGISQYRLKAKRGQLDELSQIIDSISDINSRLMNL